MTKDEALKLAQEALESARQNHGLVLTSYPAQEAWHFHRVDEKISVALTAIKEALAKPEQEPVAWMRHDGARVTTAADRKNYPDYETRYSVALYTTPPQRTWVDLTDDEWQELADKYDIIIWSKFRREIEARLKEKNT